MIDEISSGLQVTALLLPAAYIISQSVVYSKITDICNTNYRKFNANKFESVDAAASELIKEYYPIKHFLVKNKFNKVYFYPTRFLGNEKVKQLKNMYTLEK